MVDSTKKTVTKQIDTTTPTGPDQNPPPVEMLFPATIDTFKEIWEAILGDINNPQVNPIAQRATVEELLRQLRTAINERNSGIFQNIKEMNDYLLTHEQQLAQMMKSGKSKSLQAQVTTTIDQLRLEIQ